MIAKKRLLILIPIICGLAMLILDGATAIDGARNGLDICLYTVIPTLFPFIFLSSILSATLSDVNSNGMNAICRLYRMPKGAGGILVTGLLGGYPVGAKCVGDFVVQSQLSTAEAQRMFVFCNAAGPAFLFGIVGNVFTEHWVPWCLWGIHLSSGFVIARLSGSRTTNIIEARPAIVPSIPQQLRQTIRITGEICGWIILIRTALNVVYRWFLWCLPKTLLIIITGLLEISNGCIYLNEIENSGLRFVLCSFFLNFGGLCVALQTQSVAAMTKQKIYLPGKCLQALIAAIVAYTIQQYTFPRGSRLYLPLSFHFIFFIVFIIFIILLSYEKKLWHFNTH